jgi:2-dehydropantoate 2-reductase
LFLSLAVKPKKAAASGKSSLMKWNHTSNIVSNDPLTIENLLSFATKTYDIEESLLSLEKCIIKTHFPYNGVDAPGKKYLYPDNEVLKVACISFHWIQESSKKMGPKKIFWIWYCANQLLKKH